MHTMLGPLACLYLASMRGSTSFRVSTLRALSCSPEARHSQLAAAKEPGT